jgi:deoxyribodipyrimidine photo-lyase
LAAEPSALAQLPIDHEVAIVHGLRGGARAGAARVDGFVADRLDAYGERRSHPDDDAGSGLSPYLHFGHVSPHTVLRALADRFDWSPARLGDDRRGAKEGWWGLPRAAEAFLDELVTWRELGHNFAVNRDDIEDYDSLPDWARATLGKHAGDTRGWIYDRDALECAATHDEVWNAAQRQLLREGRIHNYLRMLWGKNVLAWSDSPREALRVLVELNNRWALDGRDPNSYSGITWTFGRYDRPWGPERPVFGTIRYMTSSATLRKLAIKRYLARYAGQPDTGRPMELG